MITIWEVGHRKNYEDSCSYDLLHHSEYLLSYKGGFIPDYRKDTLPLSKHIDSIGDYSLIKKIKYLSDVGVLFGFCKRFGSIKLKRVKY